MALSSREQDFLLIVRLFSRLNRYRGLMPRHLADSCVGSDTEALFLNGYLAKVTMEPDHGAAVSGWVLTHKAVAALDQVAPADNSTKGKPATRGRAVG